MSESDEDCCFMDVMDAYRLARDRNIKDVRALKSELSAAGWPADRIDAACRKLAEMLLRHA